MGVGELRLGTLVKAPQADLLVDAKEDDRVVAWEEGARRHNVDGGVVGVDHIQVVQGVDRDQVF